MVSNTEIRELPRDGETITQARAQLDCQSPHVRERSHRNRIARTQDARCWYDRLLGWYWARCGRCVNCRDRRQNRQGGQR